MNKFESLNEFLKGEVYRDFVKQIDIRGDKAFAISINDNLSDDQRLRALDVLKELRWVKTIFSKTLKEIYEQEQSLEQINKEIDDE